MSHVDEGELTAYADGAYTPGEADAQRIELHLAECVNCRNRLAQAQALSGRAAEILSVAAPASFSVPNFEELSASARPRRRMPAVPLTWAASVLLAVGLGWFGRDAMFQQQTLTEVARPEMKQAAEEQTSASDQAAGAAQAMSASPVATAPAPAPVPAPVQEREREAGRREVGLAAGAGVDARAQTNLAEADAPADARDARAQESAFSRSAKVAAAPGAPPPSAALQIVENVEYITAAEAEKRNITLYRVPELEVLRVGLVGESVSVEQKLPDGKIVSVVAVTERPAVYREDLSAAPVQLEARKSRNADMAKVGAAVAQPAAVVVMRGNTRITISGVLSADSLRALAAMVR